MPGASVLVTHAIVSDVHYSSSVVVFVGVLPDRDAIILLDGKREGQSVYTHYTTSMEATASFTPRRTPIDEWVDRKKSDPIKPAEYLCSKEHS